MPTGYTADVANGKITSFKEFALLCARNFGALINMRDEPLDAPIPEQFEPWPYYFEQLEATKQQLAHIEQATDEECEVAANNAYQDRVEANERCDASFDAENDRYEAMRLQVESWEPPTDDHRNLKKFMLEQLATSRNSKSNYPPPAKKSGADYRREKIEQLKARIVTYEKEWADEVERTKKRNEWVRQLRESLDAVPA